MLPKVSHHGEEEECYLNLNEGVFLSKELVSHALNASNNNGFMLVGFVSVSGITPTRTTFSHLKLSSLGKLSNTK